MSLQIEIGANNTILRNISKNVQTNELKQYTKLGKEMLKYIKDPKNGWVGLAAPQIGVNKRIIVVSLIDDREDEMQRYHIMINPLILEQSDETNIDSEWCLSLPWIKWEVKRSSNLKVQFLDEKGKENTLILNNLAARIVLHEIDHLDGILFIDKLENSWI